MDYKKLEEKIKDVNDLLNSVATELTDNGKRYNIKLTEIPITKVDDIVERKKYHIEVIVNEVINIK